MTHDSWLRNLQALLTELADGASPEGGFVLNPRDPGLLRSLDVLSAEQASTMASGGGASIAAHVDHVRYGLELMNRWSQGENPFPDADYGASWERLVVSEEEWAKRRAALAAEVHRWRDALGTVRHDLDETELRGVLASVAHLAYHLGAIRQINPASRGPAET